jgi:hypothetical protein
MLARRREFFGKKENCGMVGFFVEFSSLSLSLFG